MPSLVILGGASWCLGLREGRRVCVACDPIRLYHRKVLLGTISRATVLGAPPLGIVLTLRLARLVRRGCVHLWKAVELLFLLALFVMLRPRIMKLVIPFWPLQWPWRFLCVTRRRAVGLWYRWLVLWRRILLGEDSVLRPPLHDCLRAGTVVGPRGGWSLCRRPGWRSLLCPVSLSRTLLGLLLRPRRAPTRQLLAIYFHKSWLLSSFPLLLPSLSLDVFLHLGSFFLPLLLPFLALSLQHLRLRRGLRSLWRLSKR